MSIASTPIGAIPVAAEDVIAAATKSRPAKRQVTAVSDVVQQPEAR